MAQYLYHKQTRSYVFDFSKPRLRVTTTENNQTWHGIEDKFGMVYCLQHMSGEYQMFLYDTCKYTEIKDILLKKLEEKQFDNVTIIK